MPIHAYLTDVSVSRGLQDQIDDVSRLTNKVMSNSAIDKSGISTFSGKLGINPAFGGSSGIMTGAK